jgi:hypothetical protein
MKENLTESLKYLDMENQVFPIVGIDKYDSRIGDNSEFITLDFTVKNKKCGEDLCDWFERGYDCVIDADTSPGEVAKRKYLVFVEISRRTSFPRDVMKMIDDLQTLTGLESSEWQIKIADEIYPASADIIKEHIALSPHEYRQAHESELELNEWREIAGLENPKPAVKDEALLAFQRQAGII